MAWETIKGLPEVEKEIEKQNMEIFRSKTTPQNCRQQYAICLDLIEEAQQQNDREFIGHWKNELRRIEEKMTPEQFSLLMDDWEAGVAFDALFAKVKKQEAHNK